MQKKLSNKFLEMFYVLGATDEKKKWSDKDFSIFRTIRDRLYNDLNKLTRAWELYLSEYVEDIQCNLVSPDIEEIVNNTNAIDDNKVISFNYTNTYEKNYICKKNEKYIDYIHGEAKGRTIELNNMVLEIDEYLLTPRKD